jgi:hypothetical protein
MIYHVQQRNGAQYTIDSKLPERLFINQQRKTILTGLAKAWVMRENKWIPIFTGDQ